jgi:hypothetical protein
MEIKELYEIYKLTPIDKLNNGEYESGDSKNANKSEAKHFTESEFESKLKADKNFALKWG